MNTQELEVLARYLNEEQFLWATKSYLPRSEARDFFRAYWYDKYAEQEEIKIPDLCLPSENAPDA